MQKKESNRCDAKGRLSANARPKTLLMSKAAENVYGSRNSAGARAKTMTIQPQSVSTGLVKSES